MDNKTLELYFRVPYPVVVEPEATTDGSLCYRAWHPDLPGCMSHGETIGEAVGSLDDARRLYIAALLKRQQEVPLPSGVSTQGSFTINAIMLEMHPTLDEEDPNPEVQLKIAF